MSTQTTLDLDFLRAAVAGDVVTPDDAGWDAARAAWQLLADQRPALIVQAAGAGDVVEAVRYARAHGLRVAAQGTGHGARALGSLDETLLIRTSRMGDVAVDPAEKVARVGAGAVWSDVIAAAAPHGLAGLHGFSGGVGVAGYVLGGGIGWLSRRYGLASDHVRSFDVVTPGGERLRVDAEHAPDLFWALRGGGGAGVIVTAIELELVELREAYAGVLMWPMERAGEVAQRYREWIRGVPDTLTSSLRLMHVPGRAFVQVALASIGDADLAPLRALAPEVDTVGVTPAAALGDIAGDPVDPMPDVSHSRLLAALTPETIDTLVSLARPGVAVVEVRHLGGALRRPADPGAAGAVDAEALVFASGVPIDPAADLALREAFAAIDTLAPPADRETLRTFAGPYDESLPAANRTWVRVIAAAHA